MSSTLEIKTSTKRKRSVTFLFDKQLNGIRSSIPKQNKQVDWTRWIINRLAIDYFCAAFFVSVFLRNCQQYHFDVDGKTPSPRQGNDEMQSVRPGIVQ